VRSRLIDLSDPAYSFQEKDLFTAGRVKAGESRKMSGRKTAAKRAWGLIYFSASHFSAFCRRVSRSRYFDT
jgi:hypothetical protein